MQVLKWLQKLPLKLILYVAVSFKSYHKRNWFIFLFLFQVLVPWLYILSCNVKESSTYLIISDPQLTDLYSYKQHGLSLYWTQFYSDVFMKSNYNRLLRYINPDSVIFLGDLMDGGRHWTLDKFNSTYIPEFHRFHQIFPRKNARHLYMAGNHVGYRNVLNLMLFLGYWVWKSNHTIGL